CFVQLRIAKVNLVTGTQDSTPTDSPTADSNLLDESLTKEVERTLSILPDKEKLVIKYYYGTRWNRIIAGRNWRRT
ncbi:MAG: hypothetical protein MZV63_32170, partial [Marinilabiliales bacterium]|nr:hypothetical protein [Marinilabiliales bacterium]